MREMYDSTSPNDIPRNAKMVAYYVDGRYAWPQAWLDLFPNAVKVSISAIGVKTAMVGDVEDGCIWPPYKAVDWVLRARRDGYDPTIYVNEENDWEPTRHAFNARGVAHPHWWVANYDGDPTIPPGAVAKQYKHPPQTKKHFDLSSVRDYWPGVDSQNVEGFLMALEPWQQERMFLRLLRMSAGVTGENFDGEQFSHEDAQRRAILAKLDAMSAVLVEIAKDDTNSVVLSPEQMTALQASTSTTVEKTLEERTAAFEMGVQDILGALRDIDANDEEQAAAAIRRAFGRAAELDGPPSEA